MGLLWNRHDLGWDDRDASDGSGTTSGVTTDDVPDGTGTTSGGTTDGTSDGTARPGWDDRRRFRWIWFDQVARRMERQMAPVRP